MGIYSRDENKANDIHEKGVPTSKGRQRTILTKKRKKRAKIEVSAGSKSSCIFLNALVRNKRTLGIYSMDPNKVNGTNKKGVPTSRGQQDAIMSKKREKTP